MAKREDTDSPKPATVFDEAFAASLAGKYVLVGISYFDHEEKLISHEQFHGVVTACDAKSGITLALKGVQGGRTYHLPPDLSGFQKAARGEYRLKSTGEIIVDPDYTASWRLVKPAPVE